MVVLQRLALAGVVLVPTACRVCAGIDCRSGIEFALSPPLGDGRFANGHYRLTWVSEDDMDSCEYEIADDERCGGSACIVEQSCADVFDSFDGSIHVFFVDDTPESVQVTVERDDTVISDTVHTPMYEERRPPTKRCGPTCHEATVAIPVS
ncbi:MAG TPA: hypothetical protein VG755_27735 [Nannocystaceae bacterium]|nr:hypothetical protein [Nannocystaceae bacterium]